MNSKNYRALLAILSATMLFLAATGTSAAAEGTDHAQIVIKDFMFAPLTATIKAGTTVTWTNKDDEPHTVTSDTALFRSGALDTGEAYSFKFDHPGTYHFICSIHKYMVGTIVVE
ncbi:MAG TPA: cupredoxin family copper-binding protein [Steroidobacteraceae bacterium]